MKWSNLNIGAVLIGLFLLFGLINLFLVSPGRGVFVTIGFIVFFIVSNKQKYKDRRIEKYGTDNLFKAFFYKKFR